MALNDSDSSDEESGEYTITNILLGYASKTFTDDSFSQLGGYPTWLEPNYSPSASLAKCKICKAMMSLLLQLNGDLPSEFPGHERRLYLFSCRNKACRRKEGSIRAIRTVRATKVAIGKKSKEKSNYEAALQNKKLDPPSKNLGDSLFGSNPFSTNSAANPFSTSPSPTQNPFSSLPASNPFSVPNPPSPFDALASKPPQKPTIEVSAPPSSIPQSLQAPKPDSLPQTLAQKLRLSSPPPPSPQSDPFPPLSALPPPYPLYHLDADYETLDAPTPQPSSSTPTTSLEDPASSSNTKEKDDPEPYESSLDKTFLRFADRLAQNPLQVLRYEFGGTPLLYSKTDPVGKLFSSHPQNPATKINISRPQNPQIPRCQNCTRARVFEMQLTPHAIAELEVEETGMEGMEWGSVVLGVCAGDCTPAETEVGGVGYLEEWVGVQWES